MSPGKPTPIVLSPAMLAAWRRDAEECQRAIQGIAGMGELAESVQWRRENAAELATAETKVAVEMPGRFSKLLRRGLELGKQPLFRRLCNVINIGNQFHLKSGDRDVMVIDLEQPKKGIIYHVKDVFGRVKKAVIKDNGSFLDFIDTLATKYGIEATNKEPTIVKLFEGLYGSFAHFSSHAVA